MPFLLCLHSSRGPLCGGDVHVAADEGQTVVHAHLEINHPETKQHTHMHTAQVSSVSSSRPTANMSEAIYLVWSFSSLSSVCLIRVMSFGHLHNITSQRRLQTVKWFAQSENLLDNVRCGCGTYFLKGDTRLLSQPLQEICHVILCRSFALYLVVSCGQNCKNMDARFNILSQPVRRGHIINN